jgi:uncharacterized coiled-coil protein SlyX
MEKTFSPEGEWRLWFIENDGRKKVFAAAGPEERMRVAFHNAVIVGRQAILVDHLGVKQLPVDESPAPDAVFSEDATDQVKINAEIFARLQFFHDVINFVDNKNNAAIESLERRLCNLEAAGNTNADRLNKLNDLTSQIPDLRRDLDALATRLEDSSVRDLVEHLAERVGQIATHQYAKSLVAAERTRIDTLNSQVDAIVERLKSFPDAVAQLNRGDEEPVEPHSAQSPELVSDLPLGDQVRILQYQVCDIKDAIAENELAVVTQGKLIKQLQDQLAKLRTHLRATRKKAFSTDLW